MKGIYIALAVLFLAFGSMLSGCSTSCPTTAENASKQPEPVVIYPTAPVPVAVEHRAHAQLVIQAGEHWRDLAEDVAERVLKAYEDRIDILDKPIYLPAPNNRPFSVAFYNLLRTELVSRGLQVSHLKEPRSVVLEYTVQTIPFDPARLKSSKTYKEARHSDSEVIVNARMFYRNRFILHCSSTRYINENDLALYLDPLADDPFATSSKNIKATRK